MPTKEIDPEQFYKDMRKKRRDRFLLVVLGIIMIIASITMVSIEKR